MAKDNRFIHSGVRVANPDGTATVYVADQEDELAARLSRADGARLIDAGALSGDWQFGGGVATPTPSPAPNASEASKAKPAK